MSTLRRLWTQGLSRLRTTVERTNPTPSTCTLSESSSTTSSASKTNGSVKLFANKPLPYYVNFDGDVTTSRFGQNSPTSYAVYEAGKLFNQSKLEPESSHSLIAKTLLDTNKLIYHPRVRMLFLQGDLSKIDLTDCSIDQTQLKKLYAFHKENSRIDIDLTQYSKIKPLLSMIHQKIFNIIIHLKSVDELRSQFIQLRSHEIASSVMVENRNMFSMLPECCNTHFLEKMVVGEFLSIVFGTNIPAFHDLEVSQFNKVISVLQKNEFFEYFLHTTSHKPHSSLEEEGVIIHGEAPSTTQSPLRDVLGLTRYLPRYSHSGSEPIVHISHPVGLEFRSVNSVRGQVSVHCLYQFARIYFENIELYRGDKSLSEVFTLYHEGKTTEAYNKLLWSLNVENNPIAFELVQRFYTKFWSNQFKYSIDRGFERITTVKIGGLNFLVDLNNAGYRKISKIIEETFISQRLTSKASIGANMVNQFIQDQPIEVTDSPFVKGDIFQTRKESKEKRIVFVGGDYGQAGGYNDEKSMASDEQSFQKFQTLGGLMVLSQKRVFQEILKK